MDIGFIGLGQMGRAMAGNLLKAGHAVRVWNRSPAAAEPLQAAGARVAASAAEAFAGEAVITMLADDDAYRSTILDAGLIARAPRTLHINMATISVALAKALTEAHAAAGSGYLAAPVFGRTEVAEAAQLNILAAGPEAAVAQATPLFEAMGRTVWRLGEEPYRANVVKLAGNYMIAASVQTMAEAMALSRANGVGRPPVARSADGHPVRWARPQQLRGADRRWHLRARRLQAEPRRQGYPADIGSGGSRRCADAGREPGARRFPGGDHPW